MLLNEYSCSHKHVCVCSKMPTLDKVTIILTLSDCRQPCSGMGWEQVAFLAVCYVSDTCLIKKGKVSFPLLILMSKNIYFCTPPHRNMGSVSGAGEGSDSCGCLPYKSLLFKLILLLHKKSLF